MRIATLAGLMGILYLAAVWVIKLPILANLGTHEDLHCHFTGKDDWGMGDEHDGECRVTYSADGWGSGYASTTSSTSLHWLIYPLSYGVGFLTMLPGILMLNRWRRDTFVNHCQSKRKAGG